ncbi:MAG: MAPEG family protein [Rhodobacterales bacterium]|nr:MAPEG family protein [Rhodobacterales bacterium]
MTPELTALALAGLLQAVQLVLFAVPANRDVGSDYAAGPRDSAPPRPLSPRTGRLQRAMNNHFEALILFTLAVTVVTLSGQAGAFTATCAWVYLGARVLYIPAYALGLTPGRSIVWGVGFLATIAMILSALI